MKKLSTLVLMVSYLVCGAQTLSKINEPLQFSDAKEFQGKLFFFSNDGTKGYGLYYIDQNSDVLHFVTTVVEPSQLIVGGNNLYFLNDDGSHGKELFVTDGTTSGTHMVKDIYAGFASGVNYLSYTAYFNGKLYFLADDGSNGNEIWTTDGTASGTILLKDIYAGGASSVQSGTFFQEYNGRLYFFASDANGQWLWSTDGTNVGTTYVGLTNGQMNLYNGKLWVSFPMSNPNKYDIFTIGTTNTSKLSDSITAWKNTNQKWLMAKEYMGGGLLFDGKLIVQVDDSIYYLTDGTVSGTSLITAPLPKYYLNEATVLNSKIYYTNQATLTVTDLHSVTPLAPGLSQYGGFPYAINNKIIFRRSDSYGGEPWITDGTATGTMRLKDLDNGNGDGIKPDYSWTTYKYNNSLYFTDVFSPSNLWKTDGTNTGTVKISGAIDSFFTEVYDFTPFNGCLYLNAARSEFSSHSSIWKLCDGTSGITPLSEESILLYPNPSQNHLTILSSESFSNYEISNALGEVIIHSALHGNSISISELSAGVYFLHLSTPFGEIRSLKFIKE